MRRCLHHPRFAGLPPGITERELFESADRTARFCAAFYTFAAEAHTDLWYGQFMI